MNSEFSFSGTSCLSKAEESSLSYYLPIAGGRIIGFIPFPMVLALCEMQSVSSKIWTRIAMSISFDDNHYTTGTSYSRTITFFQSSLLFTHSWRENNWIHTFTKGISTMWNAISLVQDLNSSRRVHFLRR